jgi:hypothetical protein
VFGANEEVLLVSQPFQLTVMPDRSTTHFPQVRELRLHGEKGGVGEEGNATEEV